jgi:hypothetical protein
MATKRAQANDGYGTRWDPGFPVPDGTLRFALNGTTVVAKTVVAGTWYWAYAPTAADVYLKLGKTTVSAVDRTKNMPIPPGILVPIFSLDCVSAGIACDSTSSGYFYLIRIAGDDGRS